jgi:uncharacterized protein YciI
MLALSNRAHLFVHPGHKEALTRCLTTVLGCAAPLRLDAPGLEEPVLAFELPDGGSVSVEFTKDAPGEPEAGQRAWLEVRTDDPSALRQRVLEAGLTEVRHFGHDFYFRLPGGQVVGVAAVEPPAGQGQGPPTWFTLEHRPGPAWRHDLAPSEQDMREHLEFLDLLRRRGLLVAGGPRPDQPGTGMLLIRGVDADEAQRLATVEDQAVVGGQLAVTVRPWRIVTDQTAG